MNPVAQDVVSEFSRRRSLTWQKLRYWVIFLVLAFPGAILTLAIVSATNPDKDLIVVLGALFMLPIGIAIIVVNLTLKRYYLCPSCGRIPSRGGYAGGVLIDPVECPHCGVRLM